MTLDGLVTTGAKSASATGTGAAPPRTGTDAGSPVASSAPTSEAASGISVSASSRAAVVPAPVRIVAKRMAGTLLPGPERQPRRGQLRQSSAPGERRRGITCRLCPCGGHSYMIFDNGKTSSDGPAYIKDSRRARRLPEQGDGARRPSAVALLLPQAAEHPGRRRRPGAAATAV